MLLCAFIQRRIAGADRLTVKTAELKNQQKKRRIIFKFGAFL